MDVERLQFLLDLDDLGVLDEFDLEDESERIRAVEAFAALPLDADGRELRMTFRTVVVSQVLLDEPPEAWQTVQRLRDLGLDREQVLSQLTMINGIQLSQALDSKTKVDIDRYVEALEHLPLPSVADAAGRLIELARAEPGIDVDEHLDSAIESFDATQSDLLRPLVEDMIEHLVDDMVEGPLAWLTGDRTVLVPDLVAPATFTHRYNESEAALGILTAAFDLGAFRRFDVLELSDGTELEQFSAERDHIGWRGPDGWLADFEPGDLVAVTVESHEPDDVLLEPWRATVTLRAVESEPAITDELVGLVRKAYDEVVAEPGLPVTGYDLAWELLCDHPELFAEPQPPLSELCQAAGLEQRGGRVADDEAIWRNDLFGDRMAKIAELVPERHWSRVAALAVGVLDNPDASVDEVRAALDECAEPETLDALADVLFGHHLSVEDRDMRDRADAPGRLFELVERAIELARRPREVATAQYLACVLYERCGEPEIAEQHLRLAADAQRDLGPVMERMGWYLFDRGDASGAMRWWQTFSEPPTGANALRPFLAPVAGETKLGRNEPCWCGSGRKFKQCHLGSKALPALPDRVDWLWHKATAWLDHSAGNVREMLIAVAGARATGDADLELPDFGDMDEDLVLQMFQDAQHDPIVDDAVLTEGRQFALFLHERGALLPEDEQLLAASWLAIDRSVHEVTAVESGGSLTLRDLATGDEAQVDARSVHTTMKVGERFCARVVPDGATHQIVGGVFGVATGQEETVLDLCALEDPYELCAWVGRMQWGPTIRHAPGMIDEMFDRDALDEVLEALGDDVDPDRAMAALRGELQQQAQRRWLDEEVPALGGVTPRQAAADPTRRDQLERLLAEFDDHGSRFDALPDELGGMSAFSYDVDWLRRELGLD